MATTTVTGKRQVTIPADLARKHKIEPGSRLEWREGPRDDELRVRIRPGPSELLRRVREIGARYAGRAPDSAEVIRRMRDEDDPDMGEAPAGRMKERA